MLSAEKLVTYGGTSKLIMKPEKKRMKPNIWTKDSIYVRSWTKFFFRLNKIFYRKKHFSPNLSPVRKILDFILNF